MDKPETPEIENKDPTFAQQVQKLYRLTVWGRWLFIACSWVTIAPLSLWNLREEIMLLRQYFTWAAVRFGLYYHPIATVGLGFCIGMTTATLLWQSRNIIWGLPKPQLKRLEKQVLRIRQQGPSHPLWKWVCE